MIDLESFIQKIPKKQIIEDVVALTHYSDQQISSILDIYINETRISLNLIKEYLSKESNILEIGAGLCFFSLFLKENGFVITALEPSTGGFELFDILKRIILNYYSHLKLPVLHIVAEDLTIAHGQFDLIFSSNVIEHIPNLSKSLDAMVKVLHPTGKMIHGCPNYLIPYEPHLGIVVIKPLIKISERLFKTKINQKRELWDSLNFITYLSVKNYAKSKALNCCFKRGLLYEALTRIEEDPQFKQRHALLIYFYHFMKCTRTIKLLKYLPACLSTPMVFELNRRQ
ncbi:class I SAM-dependent methyltransferase [Legionella israelensis]|uniref:class I SAM-dependent methyltransferase n=1 Tax=Legionella israelensis TaxID=454 RepID=UPI00163DA849|nr:class I SAM-dependent methyltransferase [Legionella israelensis]